MHRVLLLLPTSTYRSRDFLYAADRLGIEVVVASEEASTFEPLQQTRLLTIDLLDPAGAAERVSRFHALHPLSAIVPVDEESAVVAASISSRLGLPHHGSLAAERARSKHRMREALASAAVPSPRFRVASTAESPVPLGATLRYPVVLKPVFLSGSRGVVRADDVQSFSEGFQWLCELLSSPELRRRGGEQAELVLIEDFVPGVEVAVEALLTEGRLQPLALFDKPDPLDGPYFEETIYVTPSRLDQSVQEDILEVTTRAAEALGLRHGPIHAELRLPEGGRPTVIEIAGRSIGGLCSRVLRFGLGLSLEELILKHAIGEDVKGISRESRAAGVMMIPIPKRGVLEEVTGLAAAGAVEGVSEVVITAHRGQRLIPLPEGSSYLGFIFARADMPGEAERALRDAHRRLDFRIE
ncbi:MAG TPA: ATP-grasp domain-containing protein [Vicinamibacteria bacterium]|nr:ATP-grasp domain-containing protein [Vicinamibacteria bacterium]